MQTVGVEVVTTCRACQATVAINAIVPNAACPKCARLVPLGADLWRWLFSTAVIEVAPRAVGFELSATFTSDAHSFHAILRRGPLPDGVERRAIPDAFQGARIAFVAGEDLESMRTDAQPVIRMMHCPQCGAPLEAPHGTRDLVCTYCGVTSVIEGDERFVERPLRRFHLECDVPEQPTASATWADAEAVSVDEHDLVYVLGRADLANGSKTLSIFAMDLSLAHVRWMKSGFERTEGAQLIARGDRVVLVRKNGDVPLVFRASDGEPAGTFPPASAARLRFDPKRIRSVAPLPDGTWLVLVSGVEWGGMYAHTIIHRCDDAGAPLPTWGDDMPVDPEIGTRLPELEDWSRNLFLRDSIDVVAGFDGTVLLTDGDWLAQITPTGALAAMLSAPRGVSWSYKLVALDGLNRIHALTHSGTKSGAYVVFDRQGNLMTRADRNGDSRLLGREDRLAAAKAGGAVLVGRNGGLRVIRPEGTLGYLSPTSR